MITGFHLAYSRSALGDGAGSLVAQCVGQKSVWSASSSYFVKLAVTDAAVFNFDEDLAVLKLAGLEIDQSKRLVYFE